MSPYASQGVLFLPMPLRVYIPTVTHLRVYIPTVTHLRVYYASLLHVRVYYASLLHLGVLLTTGVPQGVVNHGCTQGIASPCVHTSGYSLPVRTYLRVLLTSGYTSGCC